MSKNSISPVKFASDGLPMTEPRPHPLVVLTPVKNEGWILDRFLAITTRLADHVIVADQRSTDDSRAIAARYPNVTVVDNADPGFSEAARQSLLAQPSRLRAGHAPPNRRCRRKKTDFPLPTGRFMPIACRH